MAKGKTLGEYIEKWHVKKADWQGEHELEVLGVSNVDGITTTSHVKSDDLSGYLVIEPNTFAYNPYRINVGSVGLTPNNVYGVVSPAYIVFKVREGKLIPELLLEFLKSFDGLQQINKYARGTVRKALRFDDLCKIEVNFPDFNEQKNIFEKKLIVEKKSDELESEIQTQKQLLTQLKQSILQEAIQGKLTVEWRKQNPDVEPASELLKRIKAEKAQLIKEKKIRKEKPLPPITENEIPFELPEGWAWCRLGEIIINADNLDIQKHLSSNEIINYVDIDAIDNKKQVIRESKELPVRDLSSRARRVLKSGQILYSLVRPYLHNLAIVEEDKPNYIGSTGFAVFDCIEIKNKFVFWLLLSKYIEDLFLGYMDGFNSPSITHDQFRSTIIPIPPIKEQVFIIEKVESLMTTCQILENEVTKSEQHSQMLMQAVLKEAFESKKEVVEV